MSPTMEIFLSVLLVMAGNYTAFLSSILFSLSQDGLKEIIKKDNSASRSLQSLKLSFEEVNHGFLALEIISYMAAAAILGIYIYNIFHIISYTIYFLAGMMVVQFLFRGLFYALGIRMADKIAYKQAAILNFLRTISSPFIYFSEFLNRKIGGNSYEDQSRQEISALFESARNEGSLDPGEYRILKNMMQFSNVLVSDVMTPRTVVFSCEADSKVENIYKKQELMMYSRFPIWEGESMDEGIIGYVLSKDVLAEAVRGNNSLPVRRLAREVYFIPENAELDIALNKFLERREHLFVVVDEYGGVEGLLTMEDVLETMLGVEIVDEKDKVVDLRELAKHRRDRRISQLMKRSIS
jgi:CBS domain containing-hemolysin-like protein